MTALDTTINGRRYVTIDRNTPIYTLTAEFSGYTLFDSIIGPTTPSEYTGRGWRSHETATCRWLEDMLERREGFWLSRGEAESALAEMEADYTVTAKTITEFTVANVMSEIRKCARPITA